MKAIEVRDQVRLGPKRCLSLTLSGMSYRLFRSLITVSILSLAVAFLAHMLAYSLMAHSSRIVAYEGLTHTRSLGRWLTRLTTPDPTNAMISALAAADPDTIEEYRHWFTSAGGDEADFHEAQQLAVQVQQVWDYLGDLPESQQVVLLGDVTPAGAVAYLSHPERLDTLEGRIETLDIRPPLGSMQALQALELEGWPVLLAAVERTQAGQAQAIESIENRFPHESPRALLIDQPDNLGDALREVGYQLTAGELETISGLAARAADQQMLGRMLDSDRVRQAFNKRRDFDSSTVQVASVLGWLSGSERAEWLVSTFESAGVENALPAERLLEVAEGFRRRVRLQRAVGAEPPSQAQGFAALPLRTRWLVAVSFMVCAVGVANAMLMSVTERFSEIATMKCLGAMDSFVMVMFLFEAIIQGLIGGAVGILLGYVLAVMRGVADYGDLMFDSLPWREVSLGALLAMASGVVLAALAAVGPAWLASRLAPMEAMRVD